MQWKHLIFWFAESLEPEPEYEVIGPESNLIQQAWVIEKIVWL